MMKNNIWLTSILKELLRLRYSSIRHHAQGSNPSLKAQTLVSRLKSQPRGSNPSLEAQILVSRLKSPPQRSDHSLEAWISISGLKRPAQMLALYILPQPQGSSHSLIYFIGAFKAAASLRPLPLHILTWGQRVPLIIWRFCHHYCYPQSRVDSRGCSQINNISF